MHDNVSLLFLNKAKGKDVLEWTKAKSAYDYLSHMRRISSIKSDLKTSTTKKLEIARLRNSKRQAHSSCIY